ncbi:hypothetical protein UA08_01712 [Talaromyces atroroseus]|uniref:Zn(2)-C6 fungal-type domain-containing protein n=1 Tax=Talaromyces atroroseus TaxID=1441469 RepID=A0A1Q5QBH1_TALAT|nr:hypothetical protein UA08_01712 [Talaromyces atroroseus]OKL63292.1 hypothetical protein UA08_01712 [Talaromyces atroroseus]
MASSSEPGGPRPHACVLCQRRKVKCDRRDPCTRCAKAQVECEYRDPLPPRRRRKKNSEATMADRISRYENALQKAGIDVASLESDDAQAPVVRTATRDNINDMDVTNAAARAPSAASDVARENTPRHGSGRLITKKGKSLYLDNHLWKSVSHELQDAEDIISEDESEKSAASQTQIGEDFNSSFLFGSRQTLTHFHPNTIRIFKLWNTFLEGVNPIIKIVHVPTLQKRILDAASDLSSLSPELEALMFSIYSTALLCMQDDEVEKYFEESKPTLLSRYRQCTQQALVNAGVLGTSELMVLQAFVLFILSIRLVYNPHILWSLSGICFRIGQRIGLHKDGSKLGLSVFETEMRRRLWWEVTVLDSTIGHMAGCESHMRPMTDTKGPCNINDSALDPNMKENPVESSGPTEMIFCLMCYDLGAWLSRHENLKTSSFDGLWEFLSSTSISLEHKDSIIDEIEGLFEAKYIQHCDLSIPLHLVTFVVAKSAVACVRLRAHHPRQYQDKGLPIPQVERDLLFRLCLSILEYTDLLFSSPKTQKFHWHIDFHFPWDAFIVMLLELRHRSTGEDAAKAWQLLDVVFRRQYKALNQRRKSALHLAVANLAIKAWSAQVTESERRQVDPLPQPQVISVLWRYVNRGTSSTSNSTSTSPAPFSMSSFMLNNNTTERSLRPAEQVVKSPSRVSVTRSTSGYILTKAGNAGSYNYNQNVQSLPLSSRERDSYPMIDGDHNLSDVNTMYSMDDSPMDWGQWDTLLQQFQEYSSGDMDMFCASPLA